jgi:hypothetical protein
MKLIRYKLPEPCIPPRVQAALSFLGHCREKSHTCDPLVPAPGLSKRERAVEDSALQVLSQYFLGEMDFAERPAQAPPRPDEGEGEAPQPVVV